MKKHIIKINLGANSYKIIIGSNILSNVKRYFDTNRKFLIITDDNVPKAYIKKVRLALPRSYVFTLKHGENNKNNANYQKIMNNLIKHNFDRSDAIVAVGGGMVGDLAGFVASTYMRGIAFYNIPTTLLSQVDSSIGGKTAINMSKVKNIVGAFYQPKAVIIDTDTLKTLTEREFYSGLVEAIKMSATFDKRLFNYIKNCKDVYRHIDYIIYRSLLIKKKVVEKDEKEKGLRKVLNFGHTIGHAIEETKNYRLLHGECVGIGMLYFSSPKARENIEQILRRYNLPTTCTYDKKKVLSLIKHDKKSKDNKVSTIHVDKIGRYKVRTLSIEDIGKLLV